MKENLREFNFADDLKMKNKILEIESKYSKYIKCFEKTRQNTHELYFQRKILFSEPEKCKNIQES